MGIQGLLPLLKDVSTDAHLSDFKGQVLGIDAYVWLHRGAYGCAQDLVLGRRTNAYVNLAISRIKMMRYHGVQPYVVFDGDKLPAKAKTEDDRERRRAENLAKARKLLAEGKGKLAHDIFAKCVDVTPEMAYQLIKILKEMGVPYIVAPYEADAQLAYLEKQGVISGIVTEDSDLLIFGCKRVLFKLDQNGSCVSIERSRISACRTLALAGWTDDQIRHMAILSGCDYLDSISGVGLKIAHRYLRKHKTVTRVLSAMRLEGNLKIPEGYAKAFALAERTFLHQHVFDRCEDTGRVRLVNLTPLDEAQRAAAAGEAGADDDDDWSCIGPAMSEEEAQGIADGLIDPTTRKAMIDIHPSPPKGARAASTSSVGRSFASGSTNGGAFKRSNTSSGSFTSSADRKRTGALQATTAAPQVDGKQRRLESFFKKAPPPQSTASSSRSLSSSKSMSKSPSAPHFSTPGQGKAKAGILDSAAGGSSTVRLALFGRASQEVPVASKFFGGGGGEWDHDEDDGVLATAVQPACPEDVHSTAMLASVEEEEQRALAINGIGWDCDEVEMQPSSPPGSSKQHVTPRARRRQAGTTDSPDVDDSPDWTAGRNTSDSGPGAIGSSSGHDELVSTPASSLDDVEDGFRDASEPETSPLLQRKAVKGARQASSTRTRRGHWSFGDVDAGQGDDRVQGEEGDEEDLNGRPSFARSLVEAFKFSPVAARKEASRSAAALAMSQTPKVSKGAAASSTAAAVAKPTLLFGLEGSKMGPSTSSTGLQTPRRTVPTTMEATTMRSGGSGGRGESGRGNEEKGRKPLAVVNDNAQVMPRKGGAKSGVASAIGNGKARTPLALSTASSTSTTGAGNGSVGSSRLDAFRFRPKI